MKRLVVFGAIIGSTIMGSPLKAEDPCVALLQHGLYDEYQSFSSGSAYAFFNNEMCSAYSSYKQSSSATKASGAYGMFSGSLSLTGSQLEAIGSLLCESTTQVTDVRNRETVYRQVLNPKALDVFDSCVQQTSDGLLVDTVRSDQDHLSVTVRYRSPAGGNETRIINSVQWDSKMECKGPLSQAKTMTLTNSQVGMQCTRIGELQTPVEKGGVAVYHDGGTITVFTTAGTVVRSVGPKTRPSTPLEARVVAIERKLDGTRTEFATNLQAVQNQVPTSILFSCRETGFNQYANQWHECGPNEVVSKVMDGLRAPFEHRYMCCGLRPVRQ